MSNGPKVKVCGLTRAEDVACCVRLGVASIGLNFWPGTPRQTTTAFAAEMVQTYPDQEFVAVFVDAPKDEIAAVRKATGIRWVQLHGDESSSFVEACQPFAYKGLRLGREEDIDEAEGYGGERILVDARVEGAMPGGTGHAFPWAWAKALAAKRRVVLAGGLRADNVAEAIRTISPWQVDVASGVESAPGIKDHDLLRRFVQAVRGASPE